MFHSVGATAANNLLPKLSNPHLGGVHDDVIKHFPRYWLFVRGIHRSLVNSPHKGEWRRALRFSLICVWINGWVSNRKAGDLRRHRAHHDVTVRTFRSGDHTGHVSSHSPPTVTQPPCLDCVIVYRHIQVQWRWWKNKYPMTHGDLITEITLVNIWTPISVY